jgi:hypothetical protein
MDLHATAENHMGLLWRESATGKTRIIYYGTNGGNLYDYSMTSAPAWAATNGQRTMPMIAGTDIWLQLTDTGTTLITRYSWSGVAGTFRTVGSAGRTAHMAGGPNELGIYVAASNPSAGPHTMTVLSWVIT